MENYTRNAKWREFQNRTRAGKKRREKGLRYGKLAVLLLLVLISGYLIKNLMIRAPEQEKETAPPGLVETKGPPELTKAELQPLISDQPYFKLARKNFIVNQNGNIYNISTSLNTDLQNFLLARLDRLKTLTRGKPRRIAFTVLEPDSGRIRAMAGFDLSDPQSNPCTASDYPAASLFKIVTAAAAVQEKGFTPKTPLFYNGGKYTLYKRQLKNTRNRYTRKVYFDDAFAGSINPVFGKIGQSMLGCEILDRYADNFGFNTPINFELEVEPSSMAILPEKPYQWAEVGCGFNKTTTVSPLFAAMMAGAVVQSGTMHLPILVESVIDVDDNTVYKAEPSVFKNAVSKNTADVLVQLMQRTVNRGTAKKAFKGYSRDPALSGLTIGGKTGSLYNRDHTIKYDWFTGFAKSKNNGKKLAVSVIVGHGKYIGTRASMHARMIFKEFFENHAVSEKQNKNQSSG
ncbi:MAG: penicillin-binding transpeptidase domain-containing protein [Thermodesulfobacteriota bacterium]